MWDESRASAPGDPSLSGPPRAISDPVRRHRGTASWQPSSWPRRDVRAALRRRRLTPRSGITAGPWKQAEAASPPSPRTRSPRRAKRLPATLWGARLRLARRAARPTDTACWWADIASPPTITIASSHERAGSTAPVRSWARDAWRAATRTARDPPCASSATGASRSPESAGSAGAAGRPATAPGGPRKSTRALSSGSARRAPADFARSARRKIAEPPPSAVKRACARTSRT